MDIKYNEGAIERRGDFAKKFFYEYENYKNEINLQTIFTTLVLDKVEKRNALNNYILKNYDTVDENVKKNMDRYLHAFYGKFLSDPTELLNSPFLENPEIIEKFCPQEIKSVKGNAKEIVINEHKRNMSNIKELYIRDKNGEKLSDGETRRLMSFFIKNIRTQNKEIQDAQKKYVCKLINENSEVVKLLPKQTEFIARYVNNYMLNHRLKELGYNIGEIENDIYIMERPDDESNKGGYQFKNNILINRKSSFSRVVDLIHVTCHETEHSIQDLESKKNKDSKIGLDNAIDKILRINLKKPGYDIYEKNYRFNEIEKDAEKYGYYMAELFLRTNGFNGLAYKLKKEGNEREYKRQYEYDYRVDENKVKYTKEIFIIRKLSGIMQSRPDFLRDFPVLSQLYIADEKTGKVEAKTLEELLIQEFRVNETGKSEVYEDFCKAYIYKGDLEKFDLSKFPEEMQVNIASRLISILATEREQIGRMNYSNPNERIFEGEDGVTSEVRIKVEEFHLENSKRIMEFINKNYQQLMKLQKEGKFSSVIDMDNYNTQLLSFSNTKIYEGLGSGKQSPESKNFKLIQEVQLTANKGIEEKLISRKGEAPGDGETGKCINIEKDYKEKLNKLTDEVKLSDFKSGTKFLKEDLTNMLDGIDKENIDNLKKEFDD